MIRGIAVILVLGGLFASSGCENNSRGVVVDTQERRGFMQSGFESRVTIRRPDGSTTRLGHVGNPFFIITFIEAPAGNIGHVDPRVEKLAKRFELDSVAVIQMSIPPEKETFTEEAMAAAGQQPIEHTNLSCFLDPERRTWRILGEPDCQSILVVDRRGIFGNVNPKGTLDEPGKAIRTVERMQKEWDIEQKDMRLDY